jgi:hypothetical protein
MECIVKILTLGVMVGVCSESCECSNRKAAVVAGETIDHEPVHEIVPSWMRNIESIVEHIACTKTLPRADELAELRNKLQYLQGGWLAVYNEISIRWYNELESAREEEYYKGVGEELIIEEEKRIDNLLEQLKQSLWS